MHRVSGECISLSFILIMIFEYILTMHTFSSLHKIFICFHYSNSLNIENVVTATENNISEYFRYVLQCIRQQFETTLMTTSETIFKRD